MNAANAHELTWVAAAPLWKGLVKDRTKLRRPALLRFDSDAFMEDLFAQLESKPEELAARVAAPEQGKTTLKLYQPVHGQFHLVAASLVCQLPGLPDHAVDAAQEKAQFVLRRIAGDAELAWIAGKDAASPGAWRAVADREKLDADEELLPLFPGNFIEQGADRRRRLLFGLVPTSSRDTFHAAEVTDPARVTEDGEVVLKSADSAGALVPKLGVSGGALYVIRCVYRKPRCEPREPPLLSDPTERFAIASYFDPDAPARNIRIAMPTSFAGFAKMKKNVGFILSNEVRRKLSRVGPDALKGTFDPEDQADKGEICSLSIPIITLVATIILMVFVTLLNLIFGWIGLIKICLPINLKAKE